jgi:hypothetical protein
VLIVDRNAQPRTSDRYRGLAQSPRRSTALN